MIWVDVLKGIGIVLVVLGHCPNPFNKIIFMFHMPLFFFISGYLFKPNKNIRDYFLNKIVHLIIPYVSFLILLYPVFNRINFKSIGLETFTEHVMKPLIGGRNLSGVLSVFWFVTTLFLTQQLMNILMVKLNSLYLIIFSSLLLIMGYINSIYFPEFWLPWNANVVFASLPIFHIGFLYNKFKIKQNKLLLGSLFLIVLMMTLYFSKNTYDMRNANYGIPVVTLFSSIVFIVTLIEFSKLISKISIIEKPLSELGKASMVIMFLHQAIIVIILKFITNNTAVGFIGSVIFSYLAYIILLQNKTCRAIFLGSKRDFVELFARFNKAFK
jgi:polysaccharide biosynthesis protein PslL